MITDSFDGSLTSVVPLNKACTKRQRYCTVQLLELVLVLGCVCVCVRWRVSWTVSRGGESVGAKSGAAKHPASGSRHTERGVRQNFPFVFKSSWLTRFSATAEEHGSQRSSKSQAGLEDKLRRSALSNHFNMIIKIITSCGEEKGRTEETGRGWLKDSLRRN